MKKHLILLFFLIPNILLPGIKFQGTNASLNFDKTNSTLSLENNITGFTGTLKIRTAAADNIKTSSAKTIGFSGGSIQVANNVIDLTGGTYDPKAAGTDEIILQNGNILSISAGSSVQHIVSVASSATASIIGTPNFSSAVVVGDSATLNLGLRHKLGQNITLGANSTMVLTDDLSLQDGIKFDGTGVSGGTAVVDLTKHSLEIGSSGATSAWTGTINFKRAQDIQINGPAVLSGTWNFVTDGTDKQSVLNGNGNVLDLAGGGTIQVGSDHTLFISDLTIKSFGNGAGTFSLANSATTPGTVVLSNVTLELSANYTHAAGQIIVRGDNTRVIVGKSAGGAPYTFTLDVLNSAASTEIETLNIDGQVLIYETLGGDNTSPFKKLLGSGAGQGVLSLSATGTEVATNGGVVRSAISNVVSIDTTIDAVANNGSTVTLTNNYNLFTNVSSPGSAPTGRIVVTNTAAPTSKTVTIDGSNYFWQFPGGTYDVLKIAEGVTVTLQNVVLKDFSLDNVEFVHATTSVLKFGDGVIMSLGRDNDLPIGTRGLTFSGNATIQGNGHTLRLTSASNIVQSGAGKTLTIANTALKLENATALACSDSAAKIKLLSSKLLINQAGWTIGTGSLDIGEKVYFDSTVSSAVNGQSLVDFTTTGTLTIGSASTLVLGRNINFQYRPNPTNNANTQTPVYFARRHLVLADKSSTLMANGCTITSTATAFSLDYGNLLVDNDVILNVALGTGCDVEISDVINLEILGAGNFVVDGKVSYLAGQSEPYFKVFGPSLASAKYGLTDPVTIQAFNDAYNQGFKVVGSSSSDWLYTAVAVLDTSTSYTSDPEILTLRATDGAVSHIKLKDATKQTYSGGVVGHRSCDISVDGYFTYSDSSYNGYYHQSPRPLFNIAGRRTTPFVSPVTRGNFNSIFIANQEMYGIWSFNGWVANTWTQLPVITANVSISTIDGTVDFQSLAAWDDSTLWRVDRPTGNLIKRTSGGAESTLALPSGFAGNVVALSTKQTKTNYMAIASSTGQAFIAKDNGPWQNLGLSGVVKIAVGARGTIAVLVKRDSAVHGTLFPLLVRSGGYFDVSGSPESTVKSGVTDLTCLRAITDAYNQGFKAPGTTSSDWLYTAVAVLDTSTSYTSDPEIMTLRATDGAVSHIKLKDATKQTYSGGVVGHRSCDISADGYFAYSNSSYTGYFHKSPRPLFNTAGRINNPDISPIARSNFDISFIANQNNYNMWWSANGFVANIWSFMGAPVMVNSVASTIDGTVDFQSIASWDDSTLWRIDRSTGNLIKRTSGGAESTLALPSGLVGNVVALSTKQTKTNYMAIASSTGQAFVRKDNDPWQNLGLSGVVKIAVGARGTIAVLVKRDSAAHGTLFPLLVKPGV